MHHAIAPTHISAKDLRTIEKLEVDIMVHLLTCSKWLLFHYIKLELRGQNFESDLELNNAAIY